MCNTVPGSASLTGTGLAVDGLVEIWAGLSAVREYGLADHPPKPTDMSGLPTNREFDRAAPKHALLDYPPDVPFPDRLQAELLLRGMGVWVEPVHRVGLCGAPAQPAAGKQRPTVSLDLNRVDDAVADPAIGVAPGNRVAVVDSGDLHSTQTYMVDFLGGRAAKVSPDDKLGHGTAVADLIRHIDNNAIVSAVRVVDDSNQTSHELLCGMTYALWSRLFDVVNVSLSAQGAPGCMTVLGGSLAMVLDICVGSGSVPTIVAAAGNADTNEGFGYPAQLPGATVVCAWDFDEKPTTYNVRVPQHIAPVHATGGMKKDGFGTITSPSGHAEQIYGTSFAAAVATAMMIP